jgi:cytochrome bd-type quinol oxidase subunit 2
VALAAAPFVVAGLVAAIPLRTAGFHLPVGAVAFAAIVAVVFLFVRSGARSEDGRELATTGVLFFMPFLIMALLWVGIATPYHSPPAENLMRYEVLVVGGIAVMCGFLFLFRIVSKRGERFYSTLFLGVSILAGAAYLVWHSFQAGMWLILIKNDAVTSHLADMVSIFDVYLFFATILTYVATGLATLSMAKTGLLSSRASKVYLCVSAIGAIVIVLRGVAYPGDPRTSSPALYEVPGILAGIPAMPWVMPCLLGAVLLRRASPGTSDEANALP